MSPSPRRVALAHSNAVHPAGAHRLDDGHDPNQRIRITVVVRARTSRDARRKAIERLSRQLPSQRRHLDRDAFIEKFGAAADDIDAAAAFVTEHGLSVEEKSAARRCVVASGRVADIDEAFGVVSGLYAWKSGTYRSHDRPVHVPEHLAGIVLGVLGLDNRPLMAHHSFAHAGFDFTDRQTVMKAYGFPEDTDGAGQAIGIVALGGGFHESDVREALGPERRVRVVELGGQRNDPADPKLIADLWRAMKNAWNGKGPPPNLKVTPEQVDQFKWTVEITADVENVARFAAGADVVVYFVPDDLQGKYAAFTNALVDPDGPSVVSCSWGTHERSVSKNHAFLLDDVFSFAVLRGVTLCFSSGDDGDGTGGKQPLAGSAHFPATSPFVLACGGTMREAKAPDSEVVWNEALGLAHMASGGGVSETFGPPWWQPKAMVEQRACGGVGRAVPDVAGKADMKTGYKTTVGGIDMPVGGTSSVAPLWAALVARVNQKLGHRIGFVTPLLYLHRDRFARATRSVSRGSNGAYDAHEGWDACTGWGTPVGRALVDAMDGT